MVGKLMLALGVGASLAFSFVAAAGPAPEYNPVRTHLSIGPEASRLLVGFRATADNVVAETIRTRIHAEGFVSRQALTGPGDVVQLAQRAKLDMATSRQLTSSMHVLYLRKTLYGIDVETAINALRADPAVKFADVDRRRYPQSLPNDPLFYPTGGAAGQWYMMTPSTATQASDAAATDTVSAWALTTGSTSTVIAEVGTGVRFDHPDLLRAGFGGRLLPGYDFVAEDRSRTTGSPLKTYLIANDGDGWDPDPSDPGDWIGSSDQANALFPSAECPLADSSWHGTRVMGILGAVTNNDRGIAGMTWNPYVLPVRALGKCGGYDSDIIAGMQWAAGMSVIGVPQNPYPADIINLSLGGSGNCPSAYAYAINSLTAVGVLIVAAAGNTSGPVDAPANCAGVLAVAGLRNVGTKVGYSNMGAQVGISAPAGNCVTYGGSCLKSIDTTANTGLTVPADSTYTNEANPNLGTSFSAPIVAGTAALMRAVNANLTPTQLIARLKSSASPFPQPAGFPVCPAVATNGSEECACPNDGSQCGAGMLNALSAVHEALRPIAAVLLPATTAVGSSATLDATGSAASCGRTVASYAWTASGGVNLAPGTAGAAKATVTPTGSAGSITLVITDSAGAVDAAILSVGADGSITAAAITPAAAGTDATACPRTLMFTPAAPTVTESFSPESVAENQVSLLTITLVNSNPFDLTQAGLIATLAANLAMVPTSNTAPATTCGRALSTLTTTASTITLSGADIPPNGKCTIAVPVRSAVQGSYTNIVGAKALTTGPAGANTDAASATLTVTAPSKSGGGALDWWDTMFIVGMLLARRRPVKRGPVR